MRFVTCGHTHLPLTAERNGVRYINSGTWIESPPCPFVSVKGSEVRLETWPPMLEDQHAAEEEQDFPAAAAPRIRPAITRGVTPQIA